MNLFVCLKMVPDTVEELEIGPDQRSLDAEMVRYRLGDPDEHALEQALLLKEKYGGIVTVLALEAPEVDDVIFTALAKGADKAVKLAGDFASARGLGVAGLLAEYLTRTGSMTGETVVLLQSQAIDDLEGEIGAYLADLLQLPYMGVVTDVVVAGGALSVTKEFAGGLRGQFDMAMPAVLGIQSAAKPPRYVPVAKVRAVMKTAKIETVEAASAATPSGIEVARMYKPEASGRAQMLDGTPEEVADRLVAVLSERGIL
jgi:electron transfer flavoprotein beta subunit